MGTKGKPAVYMETCCFIDIAKHRIGAGLEVDRERDVRLCRDLLNAGRDGHLTVFTSTLTIAECQHVGEGAVPRAAQDLLHRLLMSGQYVTLVQLTPFVAADARDLRWKHNISLRGADAVHLASALDQGCVEFITTDDKLKKQKIAAAMPDLAPHGLRLIRGQDTLLIPNSYRQDPLFAPPPDPSGPLSS